MGVKRVRCPACLQFLAIASSDLVHARYCRPPIDLDCTMPSAKRVLRTALFSSGMLTGLGPGAAFRRREDEGVMIAGETTATPAHAARVEPTATPAHAARVEPNPADDPASCAHRVDDDAQEVNAWTSEASEEEVVEAWQRVLTRLATSIGERQTNHIIQLAHHPSFRIEKFKRGVRSVRQLRDFASSDVEKSLQSLRFKRKTVVDDAEEGTAGMWLRDPVDVVRRQVSELTFKDAGSASAEDEVKLGHLHTQCFQEMGPDGERRYSHPMSTDLAASVFQRVRSRVMHACAAGEEGVRGWKFGFDFVLLLQAYSDKSKQTRKVSSFSHFPLHVAIVNTSLSVKEKLICRGDCVVGYLPTEMKWEVMPAARGRVRASQGARARTREGGKRKGTWGCRRRTAVAVPQGPRARTPGRWFICAAAARK